MILLRRSLTVVTLGTLASVAACGGAAAPEGAHGPASMSAEPSSVEEAQAQIASAQAELGAGGGPAADAAPAGAAATPPPPPPAPAPEPGPYAKKTEPSVQAPAVDAASSCSSPCRALASMRRAVGALCRMTGDDDARCRDARRTLVTSEARVTRCSC